jgi:hypothetical protein
VPDRGEGTIAIRSGRIQKIGSKGSRKYGDLDVRMVGIARDYGLLREFFPGALSLSEERVRERCSA